MRLYSNKDRPFHLGNLALERLARDPNVDLVPRNLEQGEHINGSDRIGT
jgi:hypothetical protein